MHRDLCRTILNPRREILSPSSSPTLLPSTSTIIAGRSTAATMAAVRKAFSFGKDLWDPSQRFETSWFLPPLALGIARLGFVSLLSLSPSPKQIPRHQSH